MDHLSYDLNIILQIITTLELLKVVSGVMVNLPKIVLLQSVCFPKCFTIPKKHLRD
jgi:hypothetical protein